MSLSIHIGAHKTASTYLEQTIWTVEKRMMAQDYMFLSPTMLRQEPLELNRALYNLSGDRRRNAELRKLMREILAGSEHVLISEEQILGRPGSAQFFGEDGRIYLDADRRLLRLLKMLNTTDATLYLSVREPASFLTSVYGGHFAFRDAPDDGRILTPEAFFGKGDPTAMRWSELIERLFGTGVERLICWRFEDLAQVKGQVLQHMLHKELADEVADLPLIRPGLSQAAYDKIAGAAAGLAVSERIQLARTAMAEYPKGPDEPALRIFDESVFEKCRAAYAQDCEKIAAMPGVEFLWPDQAV